MCWRFFLIHLKNTVNRNAQFLVLRWLRYDTVIFVLLHIYLFITYSTESGFFVTFGENFLFGFNLKNRNDQEPANFKRNLH